MTSNREPMTNALPSWTGENYYGRPQLKAAPFEPWVVGSYIFLAGLSGSSALIGALAQTKASSQANTPSRPRALRQTPSRSLPTSGLVRRSRYLALLAPTVGSVLLIYDLHTPKRFYNMMRVAKKTSPMSIGTWILLSFSAFASVGGVGQIVSDQKPRWRWPRRLAAAAQIPAACAGAGLSTYTASLISATSTPTWAAAPRETAVRFASSSMATGAAALALGETSPRVRRSLSNLLLAALTTELAASFAVDARYQQSGIADATSGSWGKVEKLGATGLGVMLPLGLLVASRLSPKYGKALAPAAGVLTLAGSALMRTSVLGVGIESAKRPDISLRFAQPDNLPKV